MIEWNLTLNGNGLQERAGDFQLCNLARRPGPDESERTSENMMDHDRSAEPTESTYRLSASWLFALLYGLGLFLPIMAVVALIGAAAATFGSLRASGSIVLAGTLGLLSISIGPVLMTRYITRSWQRALPTALFAVVAGVAVLVAFYLAAAPMDEMISPNPGSFLAVLVALSAAAAIATIVMRVSPSREQAWPRLGIGLLLGLGLAFVHSFLIAPRILQGDNALHMTWQVPPIVWVSAAFFSWQSNRHHPLISIAVLVVLELVSFALPFLTYPLLEGLGFVF